MKTKHLDEYLCMNCCGQLSVDRVLVNNFGELFCSNDCLHHYQIYIEKLAEREELERILDTEVPKKSVGSIELIKHKAS